MEDAIIVIEEVSDFWNLCVAVEEHFVDHVLQFTGRGVYLLI